MKGMEKIAVAQKKANNFRSALENAAGLGIGAKPQAGDGSHLWSHSNPAFGRCKKTDGMEEIQFLNFRLDRERCARLICGTSSNICWVFWVSEMRVFEVRGGEDHEQTSWQV